jgi:hypothetical protein
MKRGSDSFLWGIRWETIQRRGNAPLFGALLPGSYATLDDAKREQHRLEREQPMQPNPFAGGEPRPVRYLLFARRPDELHGL